MNMESIYSTGTNVVSHGNIHKQPTHMHSECTSVLVLHERASSQIPFSFLFQRVCSCSVIRSRSRLPSGQTSCSPAAMRASCSATSTGAEESPGGPARCWWTRRGRPKAPGFTSRMIGGEDCLWGSQICRRGTAGSTGSGSTGLMLTSWRQWAWSSLKVRIHTAGGEG